MTGDLSTDATDGVGQPTGCARTVPVAAVPEVGSTALAAALAAEDVPAIGQALRHDVVVVPILRLADGEVQNRVFEAPEGSVRPFELGVFSSAQTLAAFLADAPDRQFALRPGTSLVPFLTEHLGVIERVTFDPAGPHPMASTPEDVLLALAPQPGDDDVAWVSAPLVGLHARLDGTPGETADPHVCEEERPEHLPPLDLRDAAVVARVRAEGFDLSLPPQWFVVDLADPARRQKQIRSLVRRQTGVLSDRGARLRRDLRDWLDRTGEHAASAGGRLFAFLVQRDPRAAAALALVLYWYDLGPEIGGKPHLQRIADRLESGLRDGDTLVRSSTPAGPLVRHAHVERGAVELGAQHHALLVVDHWLAAPGGRGIVQLSFSTPHVDAREIVMMLADAVVLATAWVVSDPAAPATS